MTTNLLTLNTTLVIIIIHKIFQYRTSLHEAMYIILYYIILYYIILYLYLACDCNNFTFIVAEIIIIIIIIIILLLLYFDYQIVDNHDNLYGAVIMAEPLREFTRFIR